MKHTRTKARVYRSTAVAFFFAYGSLVFGGLFAFFAANSLDEPFVFAYWMAGVLLAAWGLLRIARCGVFVEENGVRVLNPLSTVHLRWPEIARFEFSSYGSCLIKRVHGRSVAIVGIQQAGWQALTKKTDTDEAKMIAELNALLESHRANADASGAGDGVTSAERAKRR